MMPEVAGNGLMCRLQEGKAGIAIYSEPTDNRIVGATGPFTAS